MAKRVAIVSDLHIHSMNSASRRDDYYLAGLRKLEEIIQANDIIIQLGDFFQTAIEPDFVKNAVLDIFNRYQREIYILPANHDVKEDRLDSLPRTSLGNLAKHKCVTLLEAGIKYDIAGFTVMALPFHIKEAKEFCNLEDIDILVGHHFYQWNLKSEEYSIQKEDVLKFRTTTLFLGHDHEPHRPVQIDNTTIYRAGSVLRKDLTAYSVTQQPKYYYFLEGSMTVCEEDISCEPAEKVFNLEEKRNFKTCAKLVSEIKSFVQAVSVGLNTQNQKTMRSVLVEMKAPKPVVEYLELAHRANYLEF